MLSGINVGTIGYDIWVNKPNHCNVGALVAASVMGYVGAQQAANMIRNPRPQSAPVSLSPNPPKSFISQIGRDVN